MRSISLASYETGEQDENGGPQRFDVRGSLINLLFGLPNIPPRELLRRDELAKRIEDFDGEEYLFEETDWGILVRCLEEISPPDRAFVEFVRRVLDAPKVDVNQK